MNILAKDDDTRFLLMKQSVALAGEGYDFCPILLQFLAQKLMHSP